MPIADAAVHDFLTRYAASLTALDADASAALWSMPATIVDDRWSGSLDSREAMAEGLRQSYPLYRRLGLDAVAFDVLETRVLTDALVLVHVRWSFRDADGALLTDSTAHYLLRQEDEGLRATVCIQVDDAERLRALAAERGVDLPGSPQDAEQAEAAAEPVAEQSGDAASRAAD